MSDRQTIPTGRLMTRLAKRFKVRYFLNLFIWTSMWALPIIPGLLTRRYFDSLEAGTAGANVTTIVVAFLAYGVARLAMMVIGMWNDAHLGFRLESLLRRNMIERMYSLPGAQSVEDSPGESISRFREDIEHVEEAHGWTADTSGAIAFSVVAVIVLSSIDLRMTLIVFTPLVIVIVIAERFGTRIRRYRVAAREATGAVTGAIGELFASVQSVKVAGTEATMIAHIDSLSERRRRLVVKDRVLSASLESVFWNVLYIGTALILILSAGSMSSGELSLGEFALFVYFLDYVTDAVFFIGLFITRIKQAGVSFERMLGFMRGSHWSELVQERDLALRGDHPLPRIETIQTVAPLETLEISGLGYHYPGTNLGVANVDLTLNRGDFVVITGKIGSGKTTLLRALLGLVDATEGEVLWNGAPVLDRAGFFAPPVSAYTPQVPHLFSMSLRENLLLGLPLGNDDLAGAAYAAVLEDDILEMPDRLDTMVGPRGMRLSGGQIQRAAAARMFLRAPDLLVFDDLSSALDIRTELTLWNRLRSDHADITSLVVSHRRPALKLATMIVVLDKGAISAVGTVDGLLESSQLFRDLWHGTIPT
ncbi:MAG TPA: ABC transporter ATP-binding protein [Actinobacteria bacterium]|nr:ABC transporter ATP-binding protein [Actinomycetota bacterium]